MIDRFCESIVLSIQIHGCVEEDLISIGTIGLIKAIGKYRPNKGTKLATATASYIENEILMHLRFFEEDS